jgi:hypothetical protein
MDNRVVVHHPDHPDRPWAISSSHYDPERHRLWIEGVTPGYRIEKEGPWYKIIGPDGEKVGKAHREEVAAQEALEEIDG